MNCIKCNAELPEAAKFCTECGANIGKTSSDSCNSCGEPLKPEAKFCQSCGESASAGFGAKPVPATNAASTQESKRKWLTNTGIFLFIPIFAIIIVLLFWENEDPGPMNASDATNNASMESAHATLERLKQKYEANPEDLVAIDSLAIMYYIAGNYETASKYYEQHLEIEADNKDVKIALGVTYLNLKRTDEAITIMNEILDKEPTYAAALLWLGQIYAASGNKEQASKNWQAIVDNHPNSEIAKMAEKRLHELTHVEDDTSGK